MSDGKLTQLSADELLARAYALDNEEDTVNEVKEGDEEESSESSKGAREWHREFGESLKLARARKEKEEMEKERGTFS